jgi:hypothetical protein
MPENPCGFLEQSVDLAGTPTCPRSKTRREGDFSPQPPEPWSPKASTAALMSSRPWPA